MKSVFTSFFIRIFSVVFPFPYFYTLPAASTLPADCGNTAFSKKTELN